MKSLRLVMAQTGPKRGDKKHNLKVMGKAANNARKKDVDLLIFPELALTGYQMRDQVYTLAEPLTGPSCRQVQKLSRENGLHIIFGMPEESQVKGVLHNTAVLIGPKGVVGAYRKMCLPTHTVFEEKRYYKEGGMPQTFETHLGRIGINICYDLYFPEITRLLTLQGSELIVCISASPSMRRTFFEALAEARAIENAVYLAYVNRVGVEDGLEFWGGSRLVSPTGSVIAQAKYDEEDFQSVSIDLDEVRKARIFIPTIKDLPSEIFESLKVSSADA